MATPASGPSHPSTSSNSAPRWGRSGEPGSAFNGLSRGGRGRGRGGGPRGGRGGRNNSSKDSKPEDNQRPPKFDNPPPTPGPATKSSSQPTATVSEPNNDKPAPSTPANRAASSHPSVPLFQPRPTVPLFPVSSGHMFPTPEAPSPRTSNAPRSSLPHSASNPAPIDMGDNVNVPTPQPNDQASYLRTVVHLTEERFGDLRAQIAANTLALETQMSDIRHDLDSVTTSSSKKGKRKLPRCETLDHPYRLQFMEHLGAHLLYLLKITKKAKLSTIAPPTDAEVAAFNARAPGAIRITETNWRYDFSRKCTEAFNREGIAVFAESFMRLVGQGWYAVPKPLPPPFRNENVVATAFISQLPYLRRLYRVKEVDEALDNSGKPSRSRGRRKNALTADRLSITNSDPELRGHRAIMKAGGKAAFIDVFGQGGARGILRGSIAALMSLSPERDNGASKRLQIGEEEKLVVGLMTQKELL
ncbi:hypothetical protein NLJ89_g3006 [Agrocybe chaxingu]|uniref:Uncharacterized protein n=1 Tax=Agrocybe chaxingu TaxID=84603 RepID=A0A9W8KAF9_9AGAR|nr:hypothetical protein NLJ89_g3006 [Agrocybe chaxingu]